MTVFGNYAQYYDLLYQDKDYDGEARFIHKLIQAHAPKSRSILELGCGTANHALLLAKRGYQVHGVDMSEEMLQKAADRLAQAPPEIAAQIQLTQGDIRQVRVNQTFDVVLSLFHVISYQTTAQDLLAAFNTIKQHLNPGGVAIFDVWYGPTVLSNPPVTRIKRLESEKIRIVRIAEPISFPNQNLVDVNYQVFISDKSNGNVFKPEIEMVLDTANLKMIDSKEWMTGNDLGFNTWGAVFIASNP
jgi:SAM-dependent methyltransferase